MLRLAARRPPAALGAGVFAVHVQGAGLARVSYQADGEAERARCLDRQRWALRVVASTGATRATLREARCLAAGDGACEYLLSWRDRERALTVVATGVVAAAAIALSGFPGGVVVACIAAPVVSAAAYIVEHWRAARTDALARAQSGAAFGRWSVDACAPSAEPPSAPEDMSLVMTLDGDLWRIAYRGTTIRLRQSRGLALLAHLVGNPGRDIHVTTLDAITPSNRPGVARGPSSDAVAVSTAGDAGEILDAQARAEYRRRATELRAELEEAEARHDARQVAAMRDELEQLEEELRLALGAGGRPRRAASDAERLRVAITHRIRAAIDQITRRHPALGEHLRDSVSTGYHCVYEPAGVSMVEHQAVRQPDRIA